MFKDSCLYIFVCRIWESWSSLSPYYAALSSPLFLLMLFISIPLAIIADIFCACNELVS